jgi:hypothetical protein
MALKDITITGSIGSYPTLSYGQKTYISSTDEQSFPIEHITGSAGGATPNFNGQYSTTDLFVNITQSWSGSIDTQVGIVNFTHNTQEEFINGEYSGSSIKVTHQRLIGEDCIQLLNVSTVSINYKPFFYVAINLNTPFNPPDPSYVTIIDNFLNPNTSPNSGEVYILSTQYPTANQFGISTTRKITHIKVNRFDEQGDDNTLSLQELNSLRILFSDFPEAIDFPILSITEYPTYYLYSTDKRLPIPYLESTDNNILDYRFSASLSSITINAFNAWSGLGLVSSIDARSYFDSNQGNYLFEDTPNIPIQFTASFNIGSGMGGYFQLLDITSNSIIEQTPTLAAGTYIISSSFYPIENHTYGLFIQNSNFSPSTINNIQWQFTQSVAPQGPISNITILSPYLTENFEYSDCNVLINNVNNLEYDPNFYKVNYDVGLLVPTNQQQILDGTAEFAPVKPYNYSLNAQVLPRYNGVKTTAPDFNTSSSNGTGYGANIVVGNPSPFVGYYGAKGGSTPEVIGKTIINLDYIIDKDINVQVPALSDFTYGNQIQLFERGKYLYLDPNKDSTFFQFAGNNKYKIYRSGEYATPILYSQTGSNPGYINELSFIDPNIASIDNYYNSSTLVLLPFTTDWTILPPYEPFSQFSTFYLGNLKRPFDGGSPDTREIYFPLLFNSLSVTLPALSGYIDLIGPLSYSNTFAFDIPRTYTNIYEYKYISTPPVIPNLSLNNRVRFKIKIRNVTGTNAFPNNPPGTEIPLYAMPITLTVAIYNRPDSSISYNIIQDTQYDIAYQTFTISAGETKEFDFTSPSFVPVNGRRIGIKAKVQITEEDWMFNYGCNGRYFQTQNGSLEIIQVPSPNSVTIDANNGNYITNIIDLPFTYPNPSPPPSTFTFPSPILNSPTSIIYLTSSFNEAYGLVYPQVSGSGYDQTIYPFELSPDYPEITTHPEYEIRFIADEDLAFPIISIWRDPNINVIALFVLRPENQLLANLPQETIDSFLIRRWIPKAGYIYLDVAADLGAGIVKPEFITDEIQAKLPEIIKDLTDKGLIT